MPSGACGRNGGGLVGAGNLGPFTALPDAPSFDIGRGGSGLFGGSDGLADPGLAISNINGGGLLGADDSFDIGDGGMLSVSPFPSQAPVSGRASS